MQDVYCLFANTGDGAYGIDAQQRIVFWNAAATKLLGYTAADAIGKLCWEVLQGHTPQGELFCQESCLLFQALRRGESPPHFDLVFRHQDGRPVPLNISSIPISTDVDGGGFQATVSLVRQMRLPPLAAKPVLRIHLLGPVRVIRADGSQVEGPLWRRVKVRALLAYLALYLGQPVRREQLLDVLWQEHSYETALSNLNTTVYNLRRSLEPDLQRGSDSRYVLYEGGSYFLNPDAGIALDLHLFEEGIHQAQLETEPRRAIAQYQQALRLYGGDYLADLTETNVWASACHHRYQELYLSSLETLADLSREIDPQMAQDAYLAVLAVQRWRESAYRSLIKMLLQQGNRAAALSRCLQLCQALEEDLQVEPSAETRAICDQARAHLVIVQK